MQSITEIALEQAACGIFTRQEAAYWVNNQGARLNALLKRGVGHGEIWRICRELYCLDKRYLRSTVNPLELAQRMHGPSYISLEFGLSYHGWIPEAVYTMTSASLDRSRSFDTPLGVFSFTRIPQSQFYTGVSRITTENGGSFLMAEPLKALADYVYAHHCHWTAIAPVLKSLRVDEQALANLTSDSFDQLMPHYRSGHVQRFLAGIRKDLKL